MDKFNSTTFAKAQDSSKNAGKLKNSQLLNQDDLPDQRFELRVSKNFLHALDELAAKEGRSRADIIRRSVGVYSMAVKEKERGNLLAFAKIKPDNNVAVEEIIAI